MSSVTQDAARTIDSPSESPAGGGWEQDLELFAEEIKAAGPSLAVPTVPIGCCAGASTADCACCDSHS